MRVHAHGTAASIDSVDVRCAAHRAHGEEARVARQRDALYDGRREAAHETIEMTRHNGVDAAAVARRTVRIVKRQKKRGENKEEEEERKKNDKIHSLTMSRAMPHATHRR